MGSASTTRSVTAAGSMLRIAPSAAVSSAVTMTRRPSSTRAATAAATSAGSTSSRIMSGLSRTAATTEPGSSAGCRGGGGSSPASTAARFAVRRRRPGSGTPGQDGPPDLLVRTCRDPVRSRRAEAVDDGQKALVVAHARPDIQHPVTSARSAARATVTVRIAGVDEMLHPRDDMFNGAAPNGHSVRPMDSSIDTHSPLLMTASRCGVTPCRPRGAPRRWTGRTGR